MRHTLWSAMVCALVFATGCSGDRDYDQSCTINSDCPLPKICVGAMPAGDAGLATRGRCIIECRVDTDCKEGLCIESVCRAPDGPCRDSEECAVFGRVCDPGLRICVQLCSARETCSSGEICSDGRCQPGSSTQGGSSDEPCGPDASSPPPRRDAGPPLRDAMASPRDAGATPDARTPPTDMNPPAQPDMNVMRGEGRYGDPCRCGADCATGLCVPDPYNNFMGQCSDRCGAGDQCPGVDRCMDVSVPERDGNCPPSGLGLQVGSIIQVCLPNETGIPCQDGANCVLEGTCLSPPNPLGDQVPVQAACAANCQADQECPIGYACSQVPLDNGQFTRICAPATEVAACPDGSNQTCGGVCPMFGGEDPLEISYCIVLGPNQPGYCSCSCNTAAECPAGFACSRDVINTGDAARPGICLPIAGYSCPLGHDSCLSMGCAPQLASEQFTRCTAPCLVAADCPDGYRCIEIPDEQGRYCIAEDP